jgi:hypothetical protein
MDAKQSDSRVVLIHPPAISKRYMRTKFLPYGMAVLYSFLKEHGIPVAQYDFLMEYLFASPEDADYHNPARTFFVEEFFAVLEGRGRHDGLLNLQRKYGGRLPRGAALYGFSIVAYHQFWASLLIAQFIKKADPRALIVFGGPFITIKPAESFVPYGGADFWVRGSGEIPLLTLYRMISEQGEISPGEVPGLVRREGDRIFGTPQAQFPAEDERAPDFEGLDLDTYRYRHPVTGHPTLFLPYRMSKGCGSRCSFCTGRLVDRYDCKSVDKVVRELSDLTGRYGVNTVQFADASVNGSPPRFAAMCDRLATEVPDIRWYAYARVRGFTGDLLEKAKRAGCFSLFWGVESAHQPTVDMLGKGFRIEEAYRCLDEASGLGIRSNVHIMYNTPHESDEVIEGFVRLVDRYIRLDEVVFMPQRFLLEAQSLMHCEPERFGLTNVRPVEHGIFEREQFSYEEANGHTSRKSFERHERCRNVLADCLEWIRYRNMVRSARGELVRLFPAKTLVYSGRYASRSPLVRRVHNGVVDWLKAQSADFSEQL